MNHEISRQDAFELESALARCRSADAEVEKIELTILGQNKLLEEAKKRSEDAYAERRALFERLDTVEEN